MLILLVSYLGSYLHIIALLSYHILSWQYRGLISSFGILLINLFLKRLLLRNIYMFLLSYIDCFKFSTRYSKCQDCKFLSPSHRTVACSMATQLGMQSWNIIIILGLKEVASYWTPKTVLLCKSLYGEIGPGVGGPVTYKRLLIKYSARLFIEQEHIAMESRIFRRARSHIFSKCLSFVQFVIWNVTN